LPDWHRAFDDPIARPDGLKLIRLHDAATFITKLLKREHDAPEWQAATEALMLVADLGGPTMFACIGVVRALNRASRRTTAQEAREGLQDHRMKTVYN
jgi:hypothetical protein